MPEKRGKAIADVVVRPGENGQPVDDIHAGEKRWFFAGLLPSGVLTRASAESSSGFRSVLDTVSIGWVDHVTSSDFKTEAVAAAVQLGFSKELITRLVEEAFTSYLDMETELGVRIPSIQIKGGDVDPSPLIILMKKNFICSIHTHSVDRRFGRLRRYGEAILKKIPATAPDADRLSMLLIRIVDHNNDRNFEHLRQIEVQGEELNRIMLDPTTSRARLGPEIYRMKHSLLIYLDGLWSTVDVLHTLRYGDAELITDTPQLLDTLLMLSENVNRQIGLAEHMSDVMSSGLEVLQTIYNNQLQSLNNRLTLTIAYLTIIGTAILVPNTLATAMGNAVFEFGPKDLGWYLALMIGSTGIATWLVYWWVKKRGLIAGKME